jgi:hypothetical protein
MKSSFLRNLAQAALIIGLLGLAYTAGKLGWLHPRADISSSIKYRQGSVAPAGNAQNQNPSYSDTLKELADALDGRFPDWLHHPMEREGYLQTLVGQLNVADIPDLIASLADRPDSATKQTLITALYEHLVRADPEKAWPLVLDVKDPSLRHQLLPLTLTFMAVHDPKMALGNLAALPPGTVPSSVYTNIFQTWANTDPTAAVTYAVSLPSGAAQTEALKAAGSSWGKASPQAALNWALSLPPEDSAVLGSVLGGIAITNPQLAAANLDKLTDPNQRNQVVQYILGASSAHGSYYGNDPAAQLSFITQATTGDAYQNAVAGLFSALTNPPTTTKLLPDGFTVSSYNDHQQDFSKAVSLLGTIADPAARTTAISSMAGGWSQTAPAAALDWANSLPDSDANARTAALKTIVSTWGKADPGALLAYVQNSPDPSAYLSLAPAIAQAASAADPQAALAFANNLPDGSAKNQALNNALIGLTKYDASGALDYAASLPDGPSRDTAIGTIVGGVAQKNPAQAVALIEQIPAGAAQTNAASSVASAWVAQNPPAFLEWLGGLPDGGVRDAAIVQLDSSGQAAKHPSTVFAQANSISNPDLRAAQVQQVLTNWAAKDPQAALDAAQNANLPDAQRAALIQSLGKFQAIAP